MDNFDQTASRRDQGLDVLHTLSGGGDAQGHANALINDLGPIGSFVVDHVFGSVWARAELSRRDRSLIVVAILVAMGGQPRQLTVHAAGALNHGLSPDELREIAIHLSGYAGFPKAIEATRVINEVIADALGDEAPPSAPAEDKDDAKRQADGIEVFDRLTGSPGGPSVEDRMAALKGGLGPLAEAAISWGFGELWARPQLSQRDRSLLIFAVLAAAGRAEQLAFHIPGALNNGVTATELEEVVLTVSLYAGFPVAASAMRAVRELS
jgi:4-carboxymuconolactone decarboxylase